jgi:hypothetical protein
MFFTFIFSKDAFLTRIEAKSGPEDAEAPIEEAPVQPEAIVPEDVAESGKVTDGLTPEEADNAAEADIVDEMAENVDEADIPEGADHSLEAENLDDANNSGEELDPEHSETGSNSDDSEGLESNSLTETNKPLEAAPEENDEAEGEMRESEATPREEGPGIVHREDKGEEEEEEAAQGGPREPDYEPEVEEEASLQETGNRWRLATLIEKVCSQNKTFLSILQKAKSIVFRRHLFESLKSIKLNTILFFIYLILYILDFQKDAIEK